MEKFIYFLGPKEGQAIESLRATLLGEAVQELRANGASNITFNIADINEEVSAAAPGRMIGPWQDMAAAVAFWHECLDHRAPIEDYLQIP